jgi:CPA2 family monovalent cation:H+ antiporter-2
MAAIPLNLKIVLILTIGFGLASILGYITYRLRLSPILGYLIAGYLIGPYSPGFEADLQVAEQLAEIGVILMMFGVGLHFKWQDLVSTCRIAIPGAILQTLIATLFGIALIYWLNESLETGIILGLAVGVASTVVLVRVLSDNGLLHTPEGHVSVGWLLVEDMITVVALLIIPVLAVSPHGEAFSSQKFALGLGFVAIKFALLILFMFTLGKRIVTYLLSKVIATDSHELFTLTVLALTFGIAVASGLVVGTSFVLGAFIAGMVMGQTALRHKVSTNSMPLKDAFVVIFFLSVGMLFNPHAIQNDLLLFLGVLGIILIIKPVTAFLITLVLKYPLKTSLTVAFALAQIGEFSFILSEEATKYDLIPDEIYDIIVACALVSIAINPIFFVYLKKVLAKKPA